MHQKDFTNFQKGKGKKGKGCWFV